MANWSADTVRTKLDLHYAANSKLRWSCLQLSSIADMTRNTRIADKVVSWILSKTTNTLRLTYFYHFVEIPVRVLSARSRWLTWPTLLALKCWSWSRHSVNLGVIKPHCITLPHGIVQREGQFESDTTITDWGFWGQLILIGVFSRVICKKWELTEHQDNITRILLPI